MKKMIIYHGSDEIVEKPLFGVGKTYNDYGQGFYTTEDLDLAKEWACTLNKNGYANKYELTIDGLKILSLSDSKYSILNWLAILLDNRILRISTPIAKNGKDYLLKHFLPNYKDYDVIIGYRADDSYFSFSKAFLMNEISLKQLSYAMKLGRLGEQVVIKSEKAFKNIIFKGFEIADNSVYYAKRKTRDENARINYQKELENDDIDGIFIRDIIRLEMKENDLRLR